GPIIEQEVERVGHDVTPDQLVAIGRDVECQALITAARVERRYDAGGLVRVGEDGVLDLAVGSQTTVTVELAEPVEFVRPLGRRGSARTLRFHADDARAAVAALGPKPLTPERTAPSSPPGPPA
ncbi:hypothetical protein AB0O63_35145, partial [Streptomyces cyaneofuscatus]